MATRGKYLHTWTLKLRLSTMKTVAQAKHYETGVGSLPSQQQGS